MTLEQKKKKNMEEKNKLVKEYIRRRAQQTNSKYPNLIDKNKLFRGIQMFMDSDLSYEEIQLKVNEIIQKLIMDELERDRKRNLNVEKKSQEKEIKSNDNNSIISKENNVPSLNSHISSFDKNKKIRQLQAQKINMMSDEDKKIYNNQKIEANKRIQMSQEKSKESVIKKEQPAVDKSYVNKPKVKTLSRNYNSNGFADSFLIFLTLIIVVVLIVIFVTLHFVGK